MGRVKVLVVLLLFLATPALGASCSAPAKAMLRIELYFGRSIPGGGLVNERQWRHFLAGQMTPRFPDGLTVLAARGQWRDTKTNAVTREQSTVVILIAPDDAGTREKLDAVTAAYKKEFRQQSVGIVESAVCAAF